MKNYKLTISYDGGRYQGWQRLKGVDNTIQGRLEATLSRILGEEVEVIGSGRTDAGTHALGQVANFHTASPLTAEEILAQLRRYLPEDIGIESCEEVDGRFHSRYLAKEKTYIYRVWNSDRPCVFQRRYVYQLEAELDENAMKAACEVFLGRQDFAAFCANKRMKKSTVRTIYQCGFRREGEELIFTFRGDGFLYNQVRIMVGTILEAGMGRLTTKEIQEILATGRREQAGYTVPAKGLCLMEVQY